MKRALRPRAAVAALAACVLLLSACGGAGAGADGDDPPVLRIGGIPDQELSVMEERFGGLADYLSQELDIPVEYRPSTDYAAVVTAFRNDDVLLGWFGGLTGVQARLGRDGAEAIAQRPRDEEFHSVFIAGRDVEASSLEDLRGTTFTFGSESSTSGHLMPRHFLREAGVDPETDFAERPSFSGSHDRTAKLVEAGSFEAGALNETVWDRLVSDGEVDTDAVRVVERTPAYVDYHWVANPALDEVYGEGTVEAVEEALLAMDEEGGEQAQQVLELFETDEFIPTENDNYATIESIARDLELIRE